MCYKYYHCDTIRACTVLFLVGVGIKSQGHSSSISHPIYVHVCRFTSRFLTLPSSKTLHPPFVGYSPPPLFLLLLCQSNFKAAPSHVQDPPLTAGGPCTRDEGLPQQLEKPPLGRRRLLCPHGEVGKQPDRQTSDRLFLIPLLLCSLVSCSLPQVWLVGEYANTSYDSRCSANDLSMFFEVRDTPSTSIPQISFSFFPPQPPSDIWVGGIWGGNELDEAATLHCKTDDGCHGNPGQAGLSLPGPYPTSTSLPQ